MSKADKMFKQLGYKKHKNVKWFELENQDEIDFLFEDKNGAIIFFKSKEIALNSKEECSILSIEMPELQVINEKVKELGWEENK